MEPKTTSGFIKVAMTSEVPEGKMKTVQIVGLEVCLANVGGTYHAIGNRCTHFHCPIAQGVLRDNIVTCPCHGSQFDIRTGEVKRGPATMPEPVYETKVEGSTIMLRQKQ
jgi:3-phenylpropionate/trans-cinnamate dioxygenase ferredoxin component